MFRDASFGKKKQNYPNNFLKIIFNYVHMGMSMDMCVQVPVEYRGVRPTGSFKSLTWVLGIDLGFSARTLLPLNH